MNSLAKYMRANRRIAKAAILQDLCPKSMGVSVKKKKLHMVRTAKLAQWCSLLVFQGFEQKNDTEIGIWGKKVRSGFPLRIYTALWQGGGWHADSSC